jgi:hypothetical protein
MRVGIRRQIASHVEDCESCQATLESLPNASDIFRDLYNVEPPLELTQQLSMGVSAAAALAAGQMSLEAAVETDAGTSSEEAIEPDEDGAPDQEDEAWAEEAGAVANAPASEEELWARPEESPEFAGVASTDLPEAVSEIEERYGVEPSYQDYDQTQTYEQYGTEYTQDPYRSAYAPPPLTLAERLGMWFAPSYGRNFIWSYALLGVATAAAVYVGIAVADSLSGGGSDALPAIGDDVVREIACDTGPLSLESGSSRLFEFDPGPLDGFQLDSIIVADKPATAAGTALVVEVGGATAMTAEAAPALSPTARRDEYGLQIIWQRNGEDAVTDCPLFVNVQASTAPSSTPEAGETPESEDETPEAEETPERTP